MGTPDKASPREDRRSDPEKQNEINHVVEETNDDSEIKEKDSANFQNGVQRVRAITSVWSTKTMILMFIL